MARPSCAKLHVVLDHRMRADDQLRLAARRPRSSICCARLALAAAGEPGHLHAQRLQPAARACGSAARPGSRSAPSARIASRRRWRWPRPARPRRSCPSRRRPAAAGASAAARARSARSRSADARCCAAVRANGSAASSCSCRPPRSGAQRRRAQPRTLALRLSAATAAAPAAPRTSAAARPDGCGPRASPAARRAADGAGSCSASRRLGKPGGTVPAGSSSSQRRALQRRRHGLAQVGLRQLRAGRIDRRQRGRPAACRRRPP